MEERQWIKAVQRGDKRYLSDIAEKYYDDIFRFCAYQTGSREDAYDLTQETFLRFIRYVESYQSRNLKGYLLTIAMNLCRNYHRAKNREETVHVRRHEDERGAAEQESTDLQGLAGHWRSAGGEGSAEYASGGFDGMAHGTPEAFAMERERARLLSEALGELPDIQREAILLHYFQNMKYREISRLTGANLSTVKSRIRQGTDKLAKLLRKERLHKEVASLLRFVVSWND